MKKFFFSALICSLLSIPVFADPCEDGTEANTGGGLNCGDNYNPDDPAPLDGGVTLLLGLTTLYGVQKLRSSNKKEIL